MSYCTTDELKSVIRNALGRVLEKHGFDKYYKHSQLWSDLEKEVFKDLYYEDLVEIYDPEEEEDDEKEYGTYHHDEELGETYIY